MPSPFRTILVPFEGSEAASVALDYGIALAKEGAALRILHLVDESLVLSEAAAGEIGYDPRPLLEEFESQGRATLNLAQRRCRALSIEPSLELMHQRPVPGIIKAVESAGCDLVLMGTHARGGLARALLGSTTEGVLRLSDVPILTVRAHTRKSLFRRALVAVDESDPADAAIALSARLATSLHTEIILCSVVDTRHLYDMSIQYGYNPTTFVKDMHARARSTVERAAATAGLEISGEIALVEGEPVNAILEAAAQQSADLIVIGSHGRRGVLRLVLGSVAEHVVRRSHIPVLVVRG